MATIRKQLVTTARPESVWDAIAAMKKALDRLS